MAFSIDTSNFGSNTSGNVTISLTVASTANLLVALISDNGDGDPGGYGVKWNGSPMTKLTTQGSGTIGSGIYYLVNPTTGTHDMVAGFTGTSNNGLGGISFIGADTVNPFGVTNNTFPNNSSFSTSITTQRANSILVDSVAATGTITPSSAVGQTSIGAGNSTGASYKATTTIGSYSMGWSGGSGATIWAQTIAEVQQPLPVVANAGFLTNFI